MKVSPAVNAPERADRWLGRFWRGAAHREARAIHWLAAKGVPAQVVRLLFLGVKLVVLALLLYSMFWIAVLIILAWGVMRFAILAGLGSDHPEPEWRTGPAGFGLYTYDGHRIDPHVHDDDD
ncbi:MAG: hypothetical protein CMK46_11025 [Porticoccus sp.]|jgi:hypothetical protein|uniref:DUF3742 family protein n=1 Tax=Porticoccus hydrocarbonoclasticus TaxID=1073414 RepID=UPI000C488B0F|nr:DUF3742 family protein [Porticoccus hydrocarbonoclasticus]MBG58799.1 hypothetical protein [Porticoccus sp.]|tara:strand:- start:3453 stop:3818 length:366 start_codon:yes stop_codon:yes gene_type:complete